MNLANFLRQATLPVKIRLLKIACRRLESRSRGGVVSIGDVPGTTDLLLLMLAWGNVGYAAGLSYLRHMSRKVLSSPGAILECGSGVSTLLVASLTRSDRTEVVVLENSEVWHRFMSQVIDALGYDHVKVVYAPLVKYEDFSWYQVNTVSLSNPIRLVVCDGPPGKTEGGRYGLLPVMQPHLAENCIVLLDDTHRQAEQDIIDNWSELTELSASRVGLRGSHAEVVIR